MRYDPNPVVWAGVIVRHEDGTVYAVELDGQRYRVVDYEMTLEEEIGHADPYGCGGAVPTGCGTVTVRLSGYGKPWREGASHAQPPVQAIAEAPRRLEAS